MIYNKLSLKQKYLIMSILIILGIALLIYVGTDNNRKMKETQAKYEKMIQEKKAENQKLQQEITAKKTETDKNKKIDDMFNQALKYYQAEKYSTAIKSCDEILNIEKNSYKAITLKGISLCYTQKYNQGAELIDKALSIKSDYGFAIFNKALSLDLVGKYDEAKAWYKKTLDVEIYPYSYYNLAIIYSREGNLKEAIDNLSQAISLKNDLKNAAKTNSGFNKIKETKEFKETVS
ncbi:MAG: hypothetical protein WCQ54_05560 [Clostridiaceae bacterium]